MTPDDIDRRFEDLEIKLSFTEDLVEQLNEIVARQQAPEPGGTPRSLRDELPPHY